MRTFMLIVVTALIAGTAGYFGKSWLPASLAALDTKSDDPSPGSSAAVRRDGISALGRLEHQSPPAPTQA